MLKYLFALVITPYCLLFASPEEETARQEDQQELSDSEAPDEEDPYWELMERAIISAMSKDALIPLNQIIENQDAYANYHWSYLFSPLYLRECIYTKLNRPREAAANHLMLTDLVSSHMEIFSDDISDDLFFIPYIFLLDKGDIRWKDTRQESIALFHLTQGLCHLVQNQHHEAILALKASAACQNRIALLANMLLQQQDEKPCMEPFSLDDFENHEWQDSEEEDNYMYWHGEKDGHEQILSIHQNELPENHYDLYKGPIYCLRQDYEKAIKQFEMGIKENDTIEWRMALAIACSMNNEPEKALSWLEGIACSSTNTHWHLPALLLKSCITNNNIAPSQGEPAAPNPKF